MIKGGCDTWPHHDTSTPRFALRSVQAPCMLHRRCSLTAAIAIPASTPFPQLDEVVAKVKAGSKEFAKLSLDERIAMLEAFRDGYRRVALESAKAACLAKGVDPESPVAGEELLAGPMVTIRILRLTAEALREVKQHGAPRLDRKS